MPKDRPLRGGLRTSTAERVALTSMALAWLAFFAIVIAGCVG